MSKHRKGKKMSKKAFKPHAWNRKQSILNFVKKFNYPFEMAEDGIDLRTMAKNFNDGPIHLEEIHKAIVTILGPKYQITSFDFDPSGGNYLGYASSKRPKEYFDYISWAKLWLWTIFQRDVAPNHIEKIYKDFDPSSVIVPCIIKITLTDGQTIYCVWDGHHTIQVCRLKGWTKFPAWIIDLDQFTTEEIENAGFGISDEERIRFGCWVAGTNMRRINGLNKRPLSHYDDFMIGLETNDSKFVAMMNILKSHGCKPKRHASQAGDWTQIKSGIECFDLEGLNGPSNGLYWSRAIAFHRKNWKKSYLVLEIFRPMSYLYQLAAIQGFNLPQSFDDELANMLIKRWGDAESIQEGIKESYWAAVHNNTLIGQQPQQDKFRVLDGLINFYKQNGGSVLLPAASCQWKV
jgi:hypothetical protein